MSNTPQTTDELARRIANKIIDQYREGIAYEIGNNRDVAVNWIAKQTSTELRELVADKERLDWLAKMNYQVDFCDENFVILKLPRVGSTLRQAIDQAMKGK